MSSERFYKYVDLVALDRDRVKVYYDFDDGSGPIVTNVASGAHGGNGEIQNSNVNFWINSGSGLFVCDTYLNQSPAGYQDIDSGNWTVLMLYNKVFRTGYSDFTLTNEILLSNLNSGSGIAIGSNGVGNYFFELATTGGPQFYCGNLAYSPKQAAYFVKNESYIFFGGYDSGTNILGIESFYLNNPYVPNPAWQLAKSNPSGGFGQFEGYVSEYVFISGALDYVVLSILLSGLIADRTTGAYVKATGFYSGITGYQNVVTTRTGITGYQPTITGTITDHCGNSVNLYDLVPLTGSINVTGLSGISGNIFYQTKVLSGAGDVLDSSIIDGMYYDDFYQATDFNGDLFESGLSNVYNNQEGFLNIL